MSMITQPEYWLRGPIEGVPALLQPVAHAMLQARMEVQVLLTDFPENLLWEQPAGLASVAFHLQHMAGVLDRLFTYASGRQLDSHQLAFLAAEGKENVNINKSRLLDEFSTRVDKALEQLRSFNENRLNEPRAVGRKQIPSTVLGLLFHAAEHAQRHNGQLLVTARILISR